MVAMWPVLVHSSVDREKLNAQQCRSGPPPEFHVSEDWHEIAAADERQWRAGLIL